MFARNLTFTGSSSQAYIIETDRPIATISLSGSTTNPTQSTSFSLRVTLSEVFSGSLSGALSVVNGTISSFQMLDSTNYIFILTA